MSVLGWFGFRVWGLQGELFSHVGALFAHCVARFRVVGFGVSVSFQGLSLKHSGVYVRV